MTLTRSSAAVSGEIWGGCEVGGAVSYAGRPVSIQLDCIHLTYLGGGGGGEEIQFPQMAAVDHVFKILHGG